MFHTQMMCIIVSLLNEKKPSWFSPLQHKVQRVSLDSTGIKRSPI